jgi:hypothetical protein
MMQDDRATNPAEAGPTAIERVQRELAETRTTLQGETAHISQLQDTLEQALLVARSVRLEAINELDRLAGELMDAARRDAALIRARAEDDARAMLARAEEEIRTLRARAEEDVQAQRAAADAAAAEQRAALDRRVQAARAELDRIQSAWTSATQALTDARRNLLGDMGDALSGALGRTEDAAPPAPAAIPEPPAAVAPPPPAPPAQEPAPEPSIAERPSRRPVVGSVPGCGTGTADAEPAPRATDFGASPVESAPQQATPPEPAPPERTPEVDEPQEITHFGMPPVQVPEDRGAAGDLELGWAPRQEITEELRGGEESAAATAEPTGWEEAEKQALFEGPPGSALQQAGQQLRAGDVAGALDTFRGVVDRSPEEVEGVISRLALMLQDASYRTHHEEVRLLLVDAYMVQGDYDRAMSLLHEPAG